MNVSEFTYLLQEPQAVNSRKQTEQLEEVLDTYPFFQSARALYLRGLKTMNSYKYNQALKYAAACTADREVLFDLITSEEFLQNRIADSISGKQPLSEAQIIMEDVIPNPDLDTDMVAKEADSPLPRNTEEAEKILDPKLFRSKDSQGERPVKDSAYEEDALKLGSPLEFKRTERHSFSEWLQLTHLKKTIGKTEDKEAEVADSPSGERDERERKFEMIDRFIAEKPKIVPSEGKSSEVDIKRSLKLDKKELMTETLARVYLEQGKYKKAIQAYRILSLKYPKKSSFFADQIKAVEKLRDDKSE